METGSFWQQTYAHVLLSLIFVMVVVALGAYAYATTTEANRFGATHVSVSGEGEVLAVPDIGQFTFSVQAEGDDAATAQEASAEAVNEILDYLEREGVAEEDVQTTNYRLNPRYVYPEQNCLRGQPCPPRERVLDGFEVNQSVRVKVRDTAGAGDLISGVGERGATNISSLNFTIDDTDELQAEARAKAIADAREKAAALAAELGMRIVRVTNFSESRGPMPYQVGRGGEFMQADQAASTARTAPSVPTGENTIRATVNLQYEIR